MPQYHQTLILIDVTDAALANNAYTERANRLLECVNKPDTMKANVACITDKIHKVVNPGQLISFGLMSKMSDRGDKFDPNSEAVTAFIKNAKFQVVIPFTATNNPKPSKFSAVFKTTPVYTAPTQWDAPKWDAPSATSVLGVDPELDKLLAEEDKIHANAKVFYTAKLASKKDDTFKNLVNVAPFGLPPVLMPKPSINFSEYYKTV